MNLIKSGTFVLTSLVLLTAQASFSACLGEAQISAVIETATKSGAGCFVKVEGSSVTQFNENRTCPLYLDEVLEKGFHVFSEYGHGCPVTSGQSISGVISKSEDGSLVLQP